MKEIDFDSFSVETERASEIRSHVIKLREQNCVENLGLLITEFGQKQAGMSAVMAKQSSLLEEDAVECYFAPADSIASGVKITQTGTELKLYKDDRILFELGFLPKNNEYAIYFLDNSRWDEISTILSALTLEVDKAKKSKSERQSVWKKRFSN